MSHVPPGSMPGGTLKTMNDIKHIVMMIERGEPVDEIVFADINAEFPEMYDHIRKVEKYLTRHITVIKTIYPFQYAMAAIHRHKPSGKRRTYTRLLHDVYVNTDNVGYGWPDQGNRWCTALKRQAISKYLSGRKNVEYHGIAHDERNRTISNKNREIRYPLVEWGITERRALEYCYDRGFTWGGLYEKMSRVSCYLCPLQRMSELEYIYNHRKELWNDMLELDKSSYRKFKSNYTLQELDRYFYERSQQGLLFAATGATDGGMTC